MPAERRIVELTDAGGRIVEPELLALAEALHRQLRPGLPADYASRMAAICAAGGRMVCLLEGGAPAALAVWRVIENTYEGRRLYVDDLVTDEARRSAGLGRALLTWLEARARADACSVLALESGVQRARAHAFYFREGMSIPSFSLRKVLL